MELLKERDQDLNVQMLKNNGSNKLPCFFEKFLQSKHTNVAHRVGQIVLPVFCCGLILTMIW